MRWRPRSTDPLSKLRAFGATFFIFSDYARPAIRLSALMELPTIFVFTHDAMGDGEDGPTHQPVEQLASFRAMPGLVVMRPGTPTRSSRPTAISCSCDTSRRSGAVAPTPADLGPQQIRGRIGGRARRLCARRRSRRQARGDPDRVGSEVSLCVQAHEELLAEGIRSRVVSMPSWDIFEHQTQEYQDSVLPPDVTARVRWSRPRPLAGSATSAGPAASSA